MPSRFDIVSKSDPVSEVSLLYALDSVGLGLRACLGQRDHHGERRQRIGDDPGRLGHPQRGLRPGP